MERHEQESGEAENPAPGGSGVGGGARRGRGAAKRLAWAALALAVVAGLVFGTRALQRTQPASPPGEAPAAQRPPATVVVATVSRERVQPLHRATGSLRAAERAEVAAREAGAVHEIRVEAGDEVERGALLAVLDDRRLRAELAGARARLAVARAGLEQRRAESERAAGDLAMKEGLFSRRAVSERELLDARREARVAGANLEAAEAEAEAASSDLALLEVRVEDLEIAAPFGGRVVARHVDPGEWVAQGDAVATLVSSGRIEAWLDVPERFAGAVDSGRLDFEVVSSSNGVAASALGVRRVADVDPRTRLFRVVAVLDDAAGALLPGQSVYAELPLGDPGDWLAVPGDAVIETFRGAAVFKAAPDPEGGPPLAERVDVEIRYRRDGLVYVESGGLREGERVVVEGNERLFPGTPLSLVESGDAVSSGPDGFQP